MNNLDRDFQLLKRRANEFNTKVNEQIANGVFELTSFIETLNDLEQDVKNKYLDDLVYANDAKLFWEKLPLETVTKFLDYLINQIDFFDKNKKAYKILGPREFIYKVTFLNNSFEILLYLYKCSDSILSFYAAQELGESEKGFLELEAALKNNYDKAYQVVAVRVIANRWVPYFEDDIYNYFKHPEESAPPNTSEILRNCLSSPYYDVAYVAAQALFVAKKLNSDNIETLLHLDDSRQKILGLKYLNDSISEKTAGRFAPTIIQLLEDEKADVSEHALETIGLLSKKFCILLAETIVESLIMRSSNRPQEYFNSKSVVAALNLTFQYNPRLQGQIIYKLRDIAFKQTGNIRSRAVFVAVGINRREFLGLVDDWKEVEPRIAKSIVNIVQGNVEVAEIVHQISETDPKDIQQNAANQIELLRKYYESGLSQAKSSFNWAIGITVFSIVAFIVSILYFGLNQDKTVIWVSAVASGLTELIAGTLLLIYQKTLAQLNNYNQQMSKIQDHLLANSFIESLSEDVRDRARLELIKSITGEKSNIMALQERKS